MNEIAVAHYITDTFAGLDVVEASGDTYFFYDPDGATDPTRRLPFATLVTSDAHDQVSNLNRSGVFRLNIGVSKNTFQSLFGAQPAASAADSVDGEYDLTALDRIMPHPVYGTMFYVCVLNPSPATFKSVKPLLAEAYDRAASRHAKVRPADQP